MEDKICQSCGMIMRVEKELGTNADGSKNKDYCVYCFKNGAFTKNYTLEQMVEHNLKFVEEFNRAAEQNFNLENAKKQMMELFPSFKRWKKND